MFRRSLNTVRPEVKPLRQYQAAHALPQAVMLTIT